MLDRERLARSLAGSRPEFMSALERMLADAPPDIAQNVTVFSGYRSFDRQKKLYDDAVGKYGAARARHHVAPPGHSNHNHGKAADLGWMGGSFKSMPKHARDWLHANAGKYGLNFRMGWEPWHIEYAGGGGDTLIGGSGGDTLSGGGSAGTMMGGAFSDTIAPKSDGWNKPDFHPVSGGSKHSWRRVEGGGEYKTSDGRVIQYRDEANWGQNPDGPSGLFGVKSGRRMFTGEDPRINLKPSFKRFFGIKAGKSGGKEPTYNSKQFKTETGGRWNPYGELPERKDYPKDKNGYLAVHRYTAPSGRPADTELRRFAKQNLPKEETVTKSKSEIALDKARDAIARGAPPKRVKDALIKLGIDPSGL